jgi:hypothetical protein
MSQSLASAFDTVTLVMTYQSKFSTSLLVVPLAELGERAVGSELLAFEQVVAAINYLAYAKLWRKLGNFTFLHHRLICM